jgi:hypothetical protein
MAVGNLPHNHLYVGQYVWRLNLLIRKIDIVEEQLKTKNVQFTHLRLSLYKNYICS